MEDLFIMNKQEDYQMFETLKNDWHYAILTYISAWRPSKQLQCCEKGSWCIPKSRGFKGTSQAAKTSLLPALKNNTKR